MVPKKEPKWRPNWSQNGTQNGPKTNLKTGPKTEGLGSSRRRSVEVQESKVGGSGVAGGSEASRTEFTEFRGFGISDAMYPEGTADDGKRAFSAIEVVINATA